MSILQDRRRLPLLLIAAGLGLFGLIQLVPVERSNPPVTYEVAWDSPDSEALARGACYDCHSNETQWPWYAYVAPVSWLVTGSVSGGREEFNFSTGEGLDASDMVEQIELGNMPKPPYPLMHPPAQLSDAQRAALIAAIEASISDD